jgi:ketosteroid isomerase-like protein
MAEARQQALDAAARERAAQAAATPPPAPVTRPAAPAGGAAAAATPPEPPAEETIRAVLAQYVSALEARDLGALKRIWPSLSGPQEEAIRDEFRNARDIDVTIDAPRITVTGDSATVSCLRRYRLQTRDGHRLQTDTRTTVVLRKAARASWIIEAIRYEQP